MQKRKSNSKIFRQRMRTVEFECFLVTLTVIISAKCGSEAFREGNYLMSSNVCIVCSLTDHEFSRSLFALRRTIRWKRSVTAILSFPTWNPAPCVSRSSVNSLPRSCKTSFFIIYKSNRNEQLVKTRSHAFKPCSSDDDKKITVNDVRFYFDSLETTFQHDPSAVKK